MFFNFPNETNCDSTPGGCNPGEAAFDNYRCPEVGGYAPNRSQRSN